MKAKVAVIMGSKTDWPTMQLAVDVLKDFGIATEVEIVSAHRTPEKMQTYALEAQERGLQVIIAGAGGAAHLPGMVASLTSLPVIGVPISLKPMNGYDSFLSILQMPKGVPVATVGIGNAGNAGLLAVRILALQDKGLALKLAKARLAQKEKVKKDGKALRASLKK